MTELQVRRVGAFVGAFGLLVLYALRGGAYDVVVRGEHAVAVLWLLALGLAFGVFPVRCPSRRALLPLAAFALLALLTARALGSTPSKGLTEIELARTLHHAAVFALP